jgi:hypothetical protein
LRSLSRVWDTSLVTACIRRISDRRFLNDANHCLIAGTILWRGFRMN